MPAYGITLLEAYQLAQKNDATFKAEQKALEGVKQNKTIARAQLLPHVTISYNNAMYNKQKVRYLTKDPTTGTTLSEEQQRRYNSYSGSVNLTQSIFNYQAIVDVKSSNAQVKMAEANFDAQKAEFIVRVVDHYLNTAYLQEQRQLLNKEYQSYQDQLTINSRLFQLGESTRIDVIETQTQLNLVNVRKLETQNALDTAIHRLESLIGTSLPAVNSVNQLKSSAFKILPIRHSQFDEWQQYVINHNPQLQAWQKQIEMADYDIQRQRAGHLPRLELYASHAIDKSNTYSTVDQRFDTNRLGLNVSMPIYSGHVITAATRQAKLKYEQSVYEKEAQKDLILNELRQYYNQYATTQKQFQSYEQVLIAAQTQVDAMKRSVRLGQRSNIDVLNANRQLFKAHGDFTMAKYNHIKTWITLLNLSGELNVSHLETIATYFQ